MRKPIFLWIVVFTLAILNTTNAQNAATDQAKTTLDKALANFNARNYDDFLANFADDFQGFTGVYSPLLIKGKDAWMNFIGGLKNYAAASYEQRQPDFRNYGDNTVICNAYFVFATVTKTGVSEVQTGRETTVLVKINGKWLIANYHFSPIF